MVAHHWQIFGRICTVFFLAAMIPHHQGVVDPFNEIEK
jgi:hypothetical protein